MRIVDGLHAAHPHVTYDVTIKIEHLLQHRDLLPRLRDTGCLFVTSAVESVDDRALAHLRKGHTRRDFVEAATLFRSIGLTLVPTFVAFHPWLTLAGYCDLLDTIAELDLVDHVPPIQLAIRLLIPEGSKLLELDEVRGLVAGFDPATLAYGWVHPDPRVDELQKTGRRPRRREDRQRSAVAVRGDQRARPRPRRHPAARSSHPSRTAGRAVPYLSEPWYCCAEPNPDEMRIV